MGILNPASMKQALVEGAERIPGINLYEQGAGKMNLLNSTVSLAPLVSFQRVAGDCSPGRRLLQALSASCF